MSRWAATPNEKKSSGWVTHNARFPGEMLIPSERPFASLDYHAEILLAVRSQTGIEVCVRFRVVFSSCKKEYPSQHLDRVLGQVGLAQKADAQFVVANNVPPVQSVFITQVRDELGHGHASACPWDNAHGVHLENVGYQPPHSLLFSSEEIEKVCVVHRL
jgi:hypothetical protein